MRKSLSYASQHSQPKQIRAVVAWGFLMPAFIIFGETADPGGLSDSSSSEWVLHYSHLKCSKASRVTGG